MLARFRIIRPLNLLFIATGQASLYYLYLSPSDEVNIFQIFLIVFSTLLTAAAGYVINDFFDYETDKINRPNRPFAKGQLSKTDILVFYVTLVISSLLLSYFSGISYWFGVVIFIHLALFLYAVKLKQFPVAGNLLVSFLIAFIFFSCALILYDTPNLVLELSAMAFLVTFIRENFKNIEDVAGDEASGRLTLPILLGTNSAFKITGVISMITGLVFILYCSVNYQQMEQIWFWVVLLGGLFYLGLGIFILVKKQHTFSSQASLLTKIQMAATIVSIYFL